MPLQSQPNDSPLLQPLARAVGTSVALLHNAGIAHGDLTSSNFIVMQDVEGVSADSACANVFVIDFGLSFNRSFFVSRAADSPAR
jgi:tRNA A-37 threonylcarbamoyl transferase component Bud32